MSKEKITESRFGKRILGFAAPIALALGILFGCNERGNVAEQAAKQLTQEAGKTTYSEEDGKFKFIISEAEDGTRTSKLVRKKDNRYIEFVNQRDIRTNEAGALNDKELRELAKEKRNDASRLYLDKWGDEQASLSQIVEAVHIIESGKNPRAKRYEAHLNDSSYGLGQLLTSTAKQLEKQKSETKYEPYSIHFIYTPKLPRITDYPVLSERVDGLQAEKDLVELYNTYVNLNGRKLNVTIDGEIDEASAELIKRVQKKNSLEATGKLDEATWKAIQKDRHVQERLYDSEINTAYTAALVEDELRFYREPELAAAAYNSGHLTPRNARIQEKLNELYGTNLATDGIFGPKTREMFRRVQEYRNKSLEEGHKIAVDGKFGTQTELAIENMWIYRQETYNAIKNDKAGSIPQNKYIPNHVRKFEAALQEVMSRES